MKLIVGLGNPEREYKGTRHNVGFETINKLAYDHNIQMNKIKHRACIGEGIISNKKVMLAKPQTYMNLSGESVREIAGFYKISSKDIIIIYDDTDIDVSEVRVRERGSAGGHNGIKNILYCLDTEEFLRIRIGIGKKPPRYDLADYVLSKFRKDEEDGIIEGITKASEAVELALKEGVAAVMNKYNHKNRSVSSSESIDNTVTRN